MMPEMDGFTLAERIKQDPDLVEPILMMLSSSGQRDDAARCRELGIKAYLMKPIRQATLLEAILTAIVPQSPAGISPATEQPRIAPTERRLRILWLRTTVNQRLAVALLNGATPSGSHNGRELPDAMVG
jgi:DNA-binding response OmpR family regulator